MELLTLENIKSLLIQLAEYSESVYWLGDPESTHLVYISPAYEKIWGRPRQPVYDNPRIWITHLHPDDQSRHPIFEMKDKVAKFGKNARFVENYRVIRPDGEVRWILDRGFPVCDESGKIIAITGVAVDVTEERQREEELKKAKLAAEAASRAKSEFIANISHDIRTPITGLLGLAESLKDTALTEHHRKDATILMNVTQELLNLLNGVIEIINLDAGSANMEQEEFSLQSICESNVSLLRAAAKHKSLDLKLIFKNNLPNLVQGNRTYLERILLNLLSNAIKFTDRGSVKFEVSQQQIDKKTVLNQFKIIDTGIGIPADKHAAIFEYFMRLTPSSRGIYKGNGLGLYATKKYVEAMAGNIAVQSTLGQGSTFIVNLPLQILAETTTSTVKPAKPAIANSAKIIDVLIIEDNVLAGHMVSKILKKCNCMVDVVKSGKEAIEFVLQKKYDFILMDVGLPDINGFQLTQQLRQLPYGSTVPIVALTGHMSLDKKQECIDVGMQDIVIKPITIEKARELFNKYIPPADRC